VPDELNIDDLSKDKRFDLSIQSYTPEDAAARKIPVARLPVTGSDLFGREEDIAFLDRAWAKKDVNVVLFVVPDGKLKKAAT